MTKMSRKRKLDPILTWIYFLFGITYAVDINLEHPYDGYFLRDSYHKNSLPAPNTESRTFILNQQSDLYKIKAENGPFEVHQTISQNLIDEVLSKSHHGNMMHRSIVFNLDVSAHIVSKDISPKIPRLQVLVHATPHIKAKSGNGQTRYWCAQIFAEVDGDEISSICVLNEKDKVCVAGLDLHKEWWTENSTSVKVSYSFHGIDKNDQCASASNTIIPGKVLLNNSANGIEKQEIATLVLTQNEQAFNEWQDQDILIDLPLEMFHLGDSFEIPIRLFKNSDLQTFVMRARVRQGLRITGARMSDPASQWSIHVDIKEHQKTGTVTAFVRDPKSYSKSANFQDVFRWQMEVVDDAYDSRETGRVVWSIEYQRNANMLEKFASQGDSKVVSEINIRRRDQQRLVPVLKVTEVVNAAILTGWEQRYPLTIYAVDDAEKFVDVTHETKCHSVEMDVLKVSSDCTSVYLDGAESRGSHNVSIIAKSGQRTSFLDIAVWIPEKMLDIQLSDTKLSRIRNWKVPKHRKKPHLKNQNLFSDEDSPDVDDGDEWRCDLQRQQALVEVFTRFYIQTHKQTDYYMGPGAFLKVTDLVKSRLRMADSRIAALSGNMVRGLEEGMTEIQLLSPRNGHVLAMREVQVSRDKVNIERLQLQLVTGMTLYVEPSLLIQGAFQATAFIDTQFMSIYQEGIVDVDIVYTDSTIMPLRYISSEDYFLSVTTLDHSVVGIAPSASPHQPHIVAKGEGSGHLISVMLRLGEICSKRKSRSLVNSTMHITVDFSQERKYFDETPYQRDAHYDSNRPSDRWDNVKSPQTSYVVHPPSEYDSKDFHAKKFATVNKDESVNTQLLAIGNDIEELVQQKDGAKQEPLRTKTSQGLSPLGIGMYVLLAVFCVAISVFMVNCIVFFVRYKRKQKPAKAKNEAISQADDWVWIGRATLERNSVYTRSSRTLMPEEDFNGNVNSNMRPMSTGSSSSGSSLAGGVGGGNLSAPNSNRNSTVSTYKGSECSIRITANPLLEEGAVGGTLPEETQSEGGMPQWDYEAMGMNYNQLLEYFDNLKESNA